MTKLKNIILLLLTCTFVFSAHAQSSGQPVTAKQYFPSEFLNVYSPDSECWVVTGVGGNGMAFGKRGVEKNETYGAQAILFKISQPGNSEEFVSFVKKRIATMNPAPRFQETAADFQQTDRRGYPCVDVRVNYDDNAADTPTGKEQLKLQIIALYCRHPVKQEFGFFAAYSHRGKTEDTKLENAARGFIEAINVPKI